METKDSINRKADHIQLAFAAQEGANDGRFNYEPMLSAHPSKGSVPPVHFAGKILRNPIWISSMTGGADHAEKINRNLAIACKEYGLGMGLGSCRPLLENKDSLKDFAVRKYIGDQPLFANLGIAQVEQLIANKQENRIDELINSLEADGLILHVNPLQEWLQPEGDVISFAPIDTIKRLLDTFKGSLIVKEVGQGFGPESLRQLMELPLEAIDFAAHGGTNFSALENMRSSEMNQSELGAVSNIGHTAVAMTELTRAMVLGNKVPIKTRGFIVSGGIKSFLDGYYHINRIPYKAIYGQASAFLKYALEGEDEVLKYTELQVKGLEMAYAFLRLK